MRRRRFQALLRGNEWYAQGRSSWHRIAGRSFVAAAMLSLCPPVLSETLDVPGSYLTIQQAIDAAEPGDSTSPPVATTNDRLQGKGIRVFGTEGPELTILDGTEVDSSLSVRQWRRPDHRPEGFRIVSGSGDPPSTARRRPSEAAWSS